jgi:hypothetical protein
MRTMIENTIKVLKENIKRNLFEIQSNQKAIRELLNQPDSVEKTAEIEEKYALNKILLTENTDFINVQLTLTNFFEKYSDTDVFNDKEMVSVHVEFKNEAECFEQTIKNQIVYNENHPFFQNEAFYKKLLTHYEKMEDYEMCSKMVKGKVQ